MNTHNTPIKKLEVDSSPEDRVSILNQIYMTVVSQAGMISKACESIEHIKGEMSRLSADVKTFSLQIQTIGTECAILSHTVNRHTRKISSLSAKIGEKEITDVLKISELQTDQAVKLTKLEAEQEVDKVKSHTTWKTLVVAASIIVGLVGLISATIGIYKTLAPVQVSTPAEAHTQQHSKK